MNRIIHLLRPKGYNPPECFGMFWNQWLHQVYLWKLCSFDFYSNHQMKTKREKETKPKK